VEDADRLESIGAIAIARTFAYGGKRNRTIYDPSEEQGSQVFTRESYYAMQRSSIAHFYDKLLLLKDLLHTQPAQIIAQERHEFMKVYLKQFYREWNLEGLS
jgi:uncharacterized protein